MKKDGRFYLKLFISTFTLSAFTFGGGYVMVPLMRRKFVEELKWINEEEMLDMVAIAQSSPGAIVINTSIISGYKLAGVLGAIITLLATVLPPLIITTIISFFYMAFEKNPIVAKVLKGMQAGVAAIIADVIYKLVIEIKKKNDILSLIIMVVAFIAGFYINIIYIILCCGAFGLIYGYIKCKKEKK